ncbi:hypothetical protein [Amaricoccus sp.]|uniref:hypothetical protein n=1 Tax=Amaricoccus sp. TaxID=1872485 RepID=UPI001B67E048|nr:hypothetical protein [Amaricoccus sp.]MBP7002596.1 hypothetical protein [Amaricoccus sp.]
MPMPHPPIVPASAPLRPRQDEARATPWLVAMLALVVASAFVADVGVPARVEPGALGAALR